MLKICQSYVFLGILHYYYNGTYYIYTLLFFLLFCRLMNHDGEDPVLQTVLSAQLTEPCVSTCVSIVKIVHYLHV